MHGRGRSDPIRPIREARRDQPFVVAQLGQSLDGRIATLSGESRWINKDAALDHVHRVRATVDAVVVGVGTVVADDPILNVRRVAGRNFRLRQARIDAAADQPPGAGPATRRGRSCAYGWRCAIRLGHARVAVDARLTAADMATRVTGSSFEFQSIQGR